MTALEEAFDLSGRSAVVTGAASGIGRSSAEVLASAGASVLCADIDPGGAEATAASIIDEGGSARAAEVDVSVRREVETLVESALQEHGRLDVMCNIAGIISMGAVVDVEEAELDRVMAVNFKGVLFGCQAAARAMASQGSGSIVNMSSGAIDVGAANLLAYSAAKASVAQLTRILATEMGGRNVRVNAVAPGFVVTGMTGRHFTRPDGTVDSAAREATLAPMRASAPLKMVGSPEDIAWAVLYLSADASRFVTGQILRPNGGVAMPW